MPPSPNRSRHALRVRSTPRRTALLAASIVAVVTASGIAGTSPGSHTAEAAPVPSGTGQLRDASASIQSEVAQTSAYGTTGSHRLADTRETDCGCSTIDPTTMRVVVAGRAGMPADITAAVVTVTATNITADTFLTAYPAGQPVPNTSTVNPRRQHDVGNSAIIPVGAGGAIDIRSTIAIGSAIDIVVDVTGFFVAADASASGRFVSVPPARIFDTRSPAATAGALAPGGSVVVPRPAGVPVDSLGLVLNVTSVEATVPGFSSVSAAGSTTATSFMNPDGSGDPLAAFVVAPLSAEGLTITAGSGGHVIVDLVGWFTGPSAAPSDEGLFVPVDPSRRLDTRGDPRNVGPAGAIEVAVADLASVAIAAVATNVTLDRTNDAGYVTAYPAGTALPDVSTVNATRPGDTIANAAITSVSTRGTAYFSDRGTDVIVDVTGYFTGEPVAATLPVPPLDNGPSRVLLVGDSTLLAVGRYNLLSVFQGFDGVYEAASCRTLGVRSCGREPVPPNSVETINAAAGSFDMVVIMAGYDEWWTTFPNSFEAVNAAARAKGARRIVWLNYREGVGYTMPDGSTANEAFVKNNQTLRDKVASGANPDVVVADWFGYTADTPTWLGSDGIHLTFTGSYGVADYISRTIASIEGRPCPQPWVEGDPVDDPCPNPDVHGPPADVVSLYT